MLGKLSWILGSQQFGHTVGEGDTVLIPQEEQIFLTKGSEKPQAPFPPQCLEPSRSGDLEAGFSHVEPVVVILGTDRVFCLLPTPFHFCFKFDVFKFYVLSACISIYHVPGAHRDQRMVLGSLELELQMVLSHHQGAGY